jgi:hypothetical protein
MEYGPELITLKKTGAVAPEMTITLGSEAAPRRRVIVD